MNAALPKLAAVLVAAIVLLQPAAGAQTLTATPEVKTALAKAAEGPDSLRRYVQRTRAIYALSYADVMLLHEAQLAAKPAPVVASAEPARR